MADTYDSLIHRAVPRYDEMTARLLEYLPANATRVLELGAEPATSRSRSPSPCREQRSTCDGSGY